MNSGAEEASAVAAADRDPLYLVHDDSLDPQALSQRAEGIAFRALPWGERQQIPEGARVVLCLGDEQIRDLAQLALERGWEIGVLPHAEARTAMATLGVKGEDVSLLRHYTSASS